MPAMGGKYGHGGLAGETATQLKRQPAKTVSYVNTKRRPAEQSSLGTGKFGGLPGGPSGGNMGSKGKKKGY